MGLQIKKRNGEWDKYIYIYISDKREGSKNRNWNLLNRATDDLLSTDSISHINIRRKPLWTYAFLYCSKMDGAFSLKKMCQKTMENFVTPIVDWMKFVMAWDKVAHKKLHGKHNVFRHAHLNPWVLWKMDIPFSSDVGISFFREGWSHLIMNRGLS